MATVSLGKWRFCVVSVPPEDHPRQKLADLNARAERLAGELTELRAELAALQSAETPSRPAEGEIFRAEVIQTESTAPSGGATGAAPPSVTEPLPHLTEKKIHRSANGGGKRVLSDLEKMIGGRWLTWIGATSMLVAIAFFIPWAWKYFQTPEWFKVLALHASSIGVLFFGLWLCRRRYVMIGHAVIGIGLFAWYGTALAALRTFDVYGQLFGEGKYAFDVFRCVQV